MTVGEDLRTSSDAVEDILSQEHARDGHETCSQSLSNHLDVGSVDTFMLPRVHCSCLSHATHDLQELGFVYSLEE